MTVLVTGGAASGKSRMAEQVCVALGAPRVYIATMEPSGAEGEDRVRSHRRMREGKGFRTVECYRDLHLAALPQAEVVLLECVGNLLANEMFGPHPPRDASQHILMGMEAVEKQTAHLVVVSNLVFSGAERYDGEMERYLEALGNSNAALAQRFDVAVESVAGLPNVLKGGLPWGRGGAGV